jgi:hypothetical protein
MPDHEGVAVLLWWQLLLQERPGDSCQQSYQGPGCRATCTQLREGPLTSARPKSESYSARLALSVHPNKERQDKNINSTILMRQTNQYVLLDY